MQGVQDKGHFLVVFTHELCRKLPPHYSRAFDAATQPFVGHAPEHWPPYTAGQERACEGQAALGHSQGHFWGPSRSPAVAECSCPHTRGHTGVLASCCPAGASVKLKISQECVKAGKQMGSGIWLGSVPDKGGNRGPGSVAKAEDGWRGFRQGQLTATSDGS